MDKEYSIELVNPDCIKLFLEKIYKYVSKFNTKFAPVNVRNQNIIHKWENDLINHYKYNINAKNLFRPTIETMVYKHRDPSTNKQEIGRGICLEKDFMVLVVNNTIYGVYISKNN